MGCGECPRNTPYSNRAHHLTATSHNTNTKRERPTPTLNNRTNALPINPRHHPHHYRQKRRTQQTILENPTTRILHQTLNKIRHHPLPNRNVFDSILAAKAQGWRCEAQPSPSGPPGRTDVVFFGLLEDPTRAVLFVDNLRSKFNEVRGREGVVVVVARLSDLQQKDLPPFLCVLCFLPLPCCTSSLCFSLVLFPLCFCALFPCCSPAFVCLSPCFSVGGCARAPRVGDASQPNPTHTPAQTHKPKHPTQPTTPKRRNTNTETHTNLFVLSFKQNRSTRCRGRR